MNWQRSLPIAMMVLIFCACKREEGKTVVSISGNYFPLSKGSEWVYQPGNAYTAIAMNGSCRGATQTIDGESYTVLHYSPGNTRVGLFFDSAFFRVENGTYYQALTNEQLVFPLADPKPFSFVFLKDGASVGEQWQSKISGTYVFSNGSMPLEQTYTTMVKEILPSLKIDTATFYSVVKTRTEIDIKGLGNNNEPAYHDTKVMERWYAKDKGLIKVDDYGSVASNPPVFGLNISRADVR